MSTNTDLLTAFFTQVQTWATVPVAYPGVTFTPPATGQWLEIYHAPNDLDPDVDGNYIVRRGLFTINVCGRPNGGAVPLYTLAEQVAAKWPKKTTITSGIITTRRPLQLSLVAEGDRLQVPVSIAYSN